MPSKISFISVAMSLCLLVVGHTAIAEDMSLDSLKDELRTEYKEDLAIYKAIEDKSLESAKQMRAKLVNMGVEAKKIRDLMKEIKSLKDMDGDVTGLKEQLDSHVNMFRQDHGDFSVLYAEYSQPKATEETVAEEVAEETTEETTAAVGQEAGGQEVPLDTAAVETSTEEVVLQEEKEEAIEEDMEKIVVSENSSDDAEEEWDTDFE